MLKVIKQMTLLSILGVGLSISAQVWSAPILTDDYLQNKEIARSQILDSNLHIQLKENLNEEDYQSWSANLKEMGNPIDLGNGSIYYEAFQDENLNMASGIVLNNNGLFYLMYKHPNTNKLVYVTNDATCNQGAHFMTLPFAKSHNVQGIEKKLAKAMQTTQHNCEQVYMSPKQISMRNNTSGKPLTKAEINALRQTAISIWGNDAKSWEMNQYVANVIVKAVTQINTCTKNLGYVPKFPGYVAKPARDYIIKNVTNIVANHLELTKKKGKYIACISSAARDHRTEALSYAF